MKILGIAGSLRASSYNLKLLNAVAAIAAAQGNFELIVHDISDVPLYNADASKPEGVTRMEDAIRAADGVLIATPEYNYGIPGVLKNAIDQASRPAYRSVFAGTPVALLGATGSTVGTARAQGQLKQVLLGMLAEVFPYPEVLVSRASTKFDDDGTLVDAPTREILGAMAAAFAGWVERRRA